MSVNRERGRMEKSELPDGMILYGYEYAKQIFNEVEGKRFTLSDAILFLLYAHPDKPIFGRVLLMKEIFLLLEEILNKNEIPDAKFVGRYYGMYSFVVASKTTNLERSGYIERRGKKGARLEQFRITEKGRNYVSKAFASLPEELQIKIKEKRKGWDQLGYDGILRYVYQKYPKYKEKSRVKRRYKPIKWGRGKG